MKKLLLSFFIFLLLIGGYINYQNNSWYKVFKIDSPTKIYIDINQNLIFDETEPIIINDIYSIDNYILEDDTINNDKIFLIKYLSDEYAIKLLLNKFVKIKDGEITINGKYYKSLLLDSALFYTNTDESKQKFINKINELNVDDYVLLNLKSKKYHKLNCKNGKQSKNFDIIKLENILDNHQKAKCCHEQTKQKDIKQNTQIETTLHSNGNLKIFFIDLNSELKPQNTCNTEACKALKNEIIKASTSIDFAIYGFNNQPEIYNALKLAKEKGVRIRWVTNNDIEEKKYYPDIEKLKTLLPNFNLNNKENSKYNYSLMHNKFFVFDNKTVFTGSSNITSTDLSGFNANYAVLVNSKEAAQSYTNEFNQMYAGYFGKDKKQTNKQNIILDNNTKIKILFSPQDLIIDNKVVELIKNAKQYIYISAFFITQKDILNALLNAHAKGVDIKIINDATNASSKYTIHHKLRDNGIKVKTENYAGKMHMKAIVCDDKYSLIGSMNFTNSGNKRNDENAIIIEDEKTAKYLKENFIYLWNKIPDKYLTIDPKAESIESIGSCFDEIDNDFDNKIDKRDEGCFIK